MFCIFQTLLIFIYPWWSWTHSYGLSNFSNAQKELGCLKMSSFQSRFEQVDVRFLPYSPCSNGCLLHFTTVKGIARFLVDHYYLLATDKMYFARFLCVEKMLYIKRRSSTSFCNVNKVKPIVPGDNFMVFLWI